MTMRILMGNDRCEMPVESWIPGGSGCCCCCCCVVLVEEKTLRLRVTVVGVCPAVVGTAGVAAAAAAAAFAAPCLGRDEVLLAARSFCGVRRNLTRFLFISLCDGGGDFGFGEIAPIRPSWISAPSQPEPAEVISLSVLYMLLLYCSNSSRCDDGFLSDKDGDGGGDGCSDDDVDSAVVFGITSEIV